MRDPESELNQLREQSLLRKLRRIEADDGIEIRVAGREQPLIQFASNDYLGLAASAELKAALAEGANQFGAGAGASRLITGSHAAHDDLEQLLAEWKRTKRALTFSSGFATALGTLTAILGKNDFVILDKLCHACLIDGARLSEATIRVFPHNNLDRLDSHLRWATERASENSRVVVVTESVFSMDGDAADLAGIVELKDRYGALLLVDEAHAVGLRGIEGRGLADELGLADRVDFQMGTLSKAIGVSGGYLCSSDAWIDLVLNRARSFIYSTAPPPAIASAAAESIRLIRGRKGDLLREKLARNISQLGGKSPIVPHLVGESEAALKLSQELENNHGFLVPAIRYPTVPRGTARLRISLSALHSSEHIQSLANALSVVSDFS
ncbi:MAG: 8-amino-7-oxononanoate synthase [Verrucomicrobiales bacterium]|jgi:8-amino-7-oxononanoate synthase